MSRNEIVFTICPLVERKQLLKHQLPLLLGGGLLTERRAVAVVALHIVVQDGTCHFHNREGRRKR